MMETLPPLWASHRGQGGIKKKTFDMPEAKRDLTTLKGIQGIELLRNPTTLELEVWVTESSTGYRFRAINVLIAGLPLSSTQFGFEETVHPIQEQFLS